MDDVSLNHEEHERYIELQLMALDFARNGDSDILESMIRAGLSVDLSDEKGNTLLMLSSYRGNVSTTRMLLDQYAQVDKRNDRGQTPLGGVCFKGNLKLAKLLLNNGADINADNGGGKTPLMFAAMFGHKEIVEYLIEKGADTQTQTFFGMSAYSLAKVTGGVRNLFGALR